MSRRFASLLVLVFSCVAFAVSTDGLSGAPGSSGVTIAGSVVDGALTPIAGVAVTLERDGKVVSKTTSIGDGSFRFTAIAPGDYRVRAEHAGFTTLTKDVRIVSGMEMVRLPRSLRGQVKSGRRPMSRSPGMGFLR